MSVSPVSEALFVRSEELASYRKIISDLQSIAKLADSAFQVTVVVDANVIIGDLLWLSSKRRNPEAKPELMETIEAGTIVACIPPFALKEITEKIPYVAARRKVDEEALYRAWEAYKGHFRIELPDPERVAQHKAGRDPDDADYIALAETISASGILSRDKDIQAMGGVVLSVEVVGHLRDYSRATAIDLNIRINGVFLGIFTAAMVKALAELIRGCAQQAARLPLWARLIILGLGLFLMLNDHSREKLHAQLQSALKAASGAMPLLLQLTEEIYRERNIQSGKAERYLNRALEILAAPTGMSGQWRGGQYAHQ